MRTLAELGLTPAQLAEVEQLDAGLVHSWLVATNAARGLERPAGFFLSGVRSGNKPPGLGDEREAQAVELAARWLANAGWLLPTEAELTDALFGPHGRLRAWASDEPLRARMLAVWLELRPAAAELERQRLDDVERYRDARRRARSSVPSIPWPSRVRQQAYASAPASVQGFSSGV